jgi:MSHA pilin protein MshD
MFARTRAGGFSLVELVVLIGVLAVGIGGLLAVYINAARASADPAAAKQALAIAQGMLGEVLLAPYDSVTGTGGTRADFNDVDDYDAYSTTGVEDINGNPVAGLGDYNVQVSVAVTPLNGVAEAKLVTVTVTGRASLSLAGYRVKYP